MKWEDYIGVDVGGCEVKEIIGRGSFGAVFRAVQISLERDVAIKIRPCPVTEDGSIDSAVIESMTAEARVLGKFQHPNIVKVYNTGLIGNTFFLVMELLRGRTLWDHLRKKSPLGKRESVHVAHEIAGGLAGAHGKGIVHRDLKPSNVFLLPGYKIKIIDFGLADAFSGMQNLSTRVEGGTPEYMAPEQWNRMPTDGRTDLYALGMILYRMLAGRPAWRASTVEEWKEAHLKSLVPDVREVTPDVPEGLARLIRLLLQKDSLARPESATDVLEYLQRLQHQHPVLAPKGGVQTVLCSLCETPNPQSATTCSACGEKLSLQAYSQDALLPDEEPPAPPKPPPPPPPPPERRKGKQRFRRRPR